MRLLIASCCLFLSLIRETLCHPVVGIVSMMHNDYEMLEYWLQYHGKIVGLENIVILDNESNIQTREILYQYSGKGLKVIYHQGPYAKKGDLTAQAFFNHLHNIDIAVPLDGDELLIAFDGKQPIAKKDIILENLKYFWESKSVCWALQQYYSSKVSSINDTISTLKYYAPHVYPVGPAKKLFRLEALVTLDHGNHSPKLRYGNCSASAEGRIGLLHFHYQGDVSLPSFSFLSSHFRSFPSLPFSFLLHY
jgi:hypothetical protein